MPSVLSIGGFGEHGGVQLKGAQFDQCAAITRKRCEIEYNLILFTNRKSHTGFRISIVDLSDLEWLNGRHYALFHTIRQILKPTASKSLKLYRPTLSATKMYPRKSSFWQWFMGERRTLSVVVKPFVKRCSKH